MESLIAYAALSSPFLVPVGRHVGQIGMGCIRDFLHGTSAARTAIHMGADMA